MPYFLFEPSDFLCFYVTFAVSRLLSVLASVPNRHALCLFSLLALLFETLYTGEGAEQMHLQDAHEQGGVDACRRTCSRRRFRITGAAARLWTRYSRGMCVCMYMSTCARVYVCMYASTCVCIWMRLWVCLCLWYYVFEPSWPAREHLFTTRPWLSFNRNRVSMHVTVTVCLSV